MAPEDAATDEYRAHWARLAAGESLTGKYRRVHKNGQDVWIQASYNPIFDEDGQVTKVIKFASDVTEIHTRSVEYENVGRAISRSLAQIEFELDGTIITANDNFLGAMGYELTEIQGQHHRIFVDPDYAQSDAYAEHWAQLGNGQFLAGQYKRIGKSGDTVWIQASYNPLLDSHGKPYKIVKFATDITEWTNTLSASVTTSVGLSTQASKLSQSLGEQTEEQRTSIMNSATAMQELNLTVKQNAKSCSEAHELASGSQESAKAGGASMQRAVSAMQEITEASQKIGNIISVIDEIAFQTNLLALNAAIEAARAGDQGRGFAVVANEVRNLARQSAEAAREIKTLVIGTLERVEHGSGLVATSGATLQTIVQEVEAVSDLLSSVATSSEQQATAVEHVAIAFEKLQSSSEVQSNLVKQVVEVSVALDQEAERLAGTLPGAATQSHESPDAANEPPDPARVI